MGALIWITFSQVFEKALHLYVINTPLFHMAVPFAIYGTLAAGVFEDVGRFFAFKIFLKKDREWRDGIAYGIGHGGIEAISSLKTALASTPILFLSSGLERVCAVIFLTFVIIKQAKNC